jgi:hypothetical protein
MKNNIKFLWLFLAVLSMSLTACKKETNTDQNSGNDILNPPAWIQYTWTKPNGMNGTDGWRFTNNDMFTVMYDQNGHQTMDLSFMNTVKTHDYTITQQSTNSSYQFTVHYNDLNSSETYQFQLTATGQLQYTDLNQTVFTYTKRN